MPLVDRLRGTPFRDPSRMGTPQDEQAREVIEFGLRLGDLLLRSGSGTRDVEAALIAVTAAMGLTDVEVDITAQSIILQHAPAGGRPVNLLRVARTQSRTTPGWPTPTGWSPTWWPAGARARRPDAG